MNRQRDLHTDAYKEYREEAADEYAQATRKAFLAGFEAAVSESEQFQLLRNWLQSERDIAMDRAEDDPTMVARRYTMIDVLVKLSEMGCKPNDDEAVTRPESRRKICPKCGHEPTEFVQHAAGTESTVQTDPDRVGNRLLELRMCNSCGCSIELILDVESHTVMTHED